MTEGRQTRIPMAIDGHFWVHAKLNGRDVKFLVDSGATMTTIDRADGERRRRRRRAAGATSMSEPATASSACRARGPTSSTVGDIVRHDVSLQVADSDDLNVLGMNYLSTLKRWGVEGRWLILVS